MMAKRKRQRNNYKLFKEAYEFEDAILARSSVDIVVDSQYLDEKARERAERITNPIHDVAFAKTFFDSDDPIFERYRNSLWSVFEWTRRIDGKVSPAALRTDYKRKVRHDNIDETGHVSIEAQKMLRTFANDHVLTAIIRYLVAENPEIYRDYVELNHADCDLIVCAIEPRRFRWLKEERSKFASYGSPWLEEQLSIDWVLKHVLS